MTQRISDTTLSVAETPEFLHLITTFDAFDWVRKGEFVARLRAAGPEYHHIASLFERRALRAHAPAHASAA